MVPLKYMLWKMEILVNQAIINAIQNCEQLTFNYDGILRVVEPHTYGITATGKESIRAYQIQGGHMSGHNESWHLFTVSKMLGVRGTGVKFSGVRQGYKRQDSVMQRIYAQL